MIIRPSISIAGLREPYWWLTDNTGLRHISFAQVYRADMPGDQTIRIYGIIFGPIHFRVGIARTTDHGGGDGY